MSVASDVERSTCVFEEANVCFDLDVCGEQVAEEISSGDLWMQCLSVCLPE